MTEQGSHRDCVASRILLDQIADKWSVLIMGTLCQGPLRFNTLKRELEGVTQKALTQTLRRLERNGIVARRVLQTSPVAVEYRITPLGESLKTPFAALFAWTVDHAAEVAQAQQDYDRRMEADGDVPAAAPIRQPFQPHTMFSEHQS